MSTVIVNMTTRQITVSVGGASATWSSLTGKPPVIASGDTEAEARAAIGAGTSDLEIGTTEGTAMAGDTALPSLMSEAEAEAGVASNARTISAERLAAAIAAHAPELSEIAIDKIANPIGGAYVAGRTNGTAGAASRAIPLNEGGTGLTVPIRTPAGHLKSKSFIVEQEAQSGTTLSFSAGCTKHESLSANKTYSFSNGVDGAGMQFQVTNTDDSPITIAFTGGKLAKGQDGIIGVDEYAIFTICQINSIISITKTIFDAS